MKMRLLTALVAACCFSQMAVASVVNTGDIVNKTTTTATVTLNQPITLDNTLTPVKGLNAGASISTIAKSTIANGNLKIHESGFKVQLALMAATPGNAAFETYATGHENDPDYKLAYRVYPTLALSAIDTIQMPDGNYDFSKSNIDNLDYTVRVVDSSKLPKAGNYVISVTGAVYTP